MQVSVSAIVLRPFDPNFMRKFWQFRVISIETEGNHD